ncbi:hypothetical protein MKK75_30905 [Methylobacterium sp. J-030]|uniref:hypothetical protein n=1 Tax=Methylobacterium sp. J-030 TaxID=2836627 RepID=UPI001FBAA0DE|nr:hypothetical protein [Methylobacterium sp. J-030]MCJ2073143.1 hypothetical protein [Methylobacterium sp. J-030]
MIVRLGKADVDGSHGKLRGIEPGLDRLIIGHTLKKAIIGSAKIAVPSEENPSYVGM